MSYFDSIQKPTFLINEDTARGNIRRMITKARAQNIRFRPHFKTHQSAEIGEWYHEEGQQAITVSSLEMGRILCRPRLGGHHRGLPGQPARDRYH